MTSPSKTNFFRQKLTQEIYLQVSFSGILIEISPPGQSFLGYRFEELITKPIRDFVEKDSFLLLSEQLQTLYRNRQAVVEIELACRHRNSIVQWFSCRICGDFNQQIWHVVMQDRTAQRGREKHLEQSEAKYQHLIEHLAAPLVIHDRFGKIYEVNRAFCDRSGYAREQLLRMNISDLDVTIRVNQSRGTGIWDQLVQGYPVIVEGVQRRKNGTCFPVEVHLSLCEIDQQQLIVALSLDISVRKRQEAHLQTLNRQLKAAHQRAMEASQTKGKFLAHMSHELRTPLNAIIGYSELLQEDMQAQEMHEYVVDLKRVHGAATHLLALINDILELSKIEAGKIRVHFESCQVSTLIDQCVATIQPMLADNHLTVEIDGSVRTMMTDRVKLRQCLLNLLSNACKFTHAGQIRLEVRPLEVDGKAWLSFAIIDNGIGIEMDKLNQLFSPFVQADESSTRKYGGTGLGLAITRHMCRMLGGDIDVDSAVGKGSTFRLRLPVIASYEGEKELSSEQVQLEPASSSRVEEANLVADDAEMVLFIDDDEIHHQQINRVLLKKGYRVISGMDGYEGLASARALRPKMILLDPWMPGFDGWQVLHELCSDPTVATIPTFLTVIDNERNRGFVLPSSDFLVKPIRPQQLAKIMSRCTGRGIFAGTHNAFVIAKDETCRANLRHHLKAHGWDVVESEDGRDVLSQIAHVQPNVVILDLLSPTIDSFTVIDQIRSAYRFQDLPIIALISKDFREEERQNIKERILTFANQYNHSLEDMLEDLLTRVVPNLQTSPAAYVQDASHSQPR